MEQLTLKPIKKVEGTVRLPGSKSLSNRILLLAALAEGTTKVENLLDSDDIRYMVDALKVLGLDFTEDRENNILEITGCGGEFPVEGADLFLGNAVRAIALSPPLWRRRARVLLSLMVSRECARDRFKTLSMVWCSLV